MMRLRVILCLAALTALLMFGGAGAALAEEMTNSIGMEFVLIPAGEFMMGTPDGGGRADYNERPRHKVIISKPFYLGKYEVTQAQWEAVMGNNPSEFKGRNNPVEHLFYVDVLDFIKKLNQKEGGNKYRLPTEAEWEYAARAGTTGDYSFGHDPEALGRYAWYWENAGKTTHPVGQKAPNPWGLYDMHGNVWEWVSDRNGGNYYAESPTTDPQGSSSGSYFIKRGGAWKSGARDCRSAARTSDDKPHHHIGFRLAYSPGR